MSNGIATERIERIAESAARAAVHASGEIKVPAHACDKESRIIKLESLVDDHGRQLNDGQKQFIRLENGLGNVAEKVGTLNTILAWVGGAVGLGLLGTAGAALVYVIVQMGHKP